MSFEKYETVIGLEVHAELKTKTKIFCGCPTTFGAEPNTQCCPVCTGMPGTLPVLNGEVVKKAVTAGLALNCNIEKFSRHHRKNYFYPDLPKAYQISQFDTPICSGGFVDIPSQGGTKRINITRIHIEEDAGKLIHGENGTLIDHNRCGVPLIEIVSEPDIRNGDEAVEYLQKLKRILEYAGVSDCKMNEGSLRCDVNLSVRKFGEGLGTRTEMKNLNSFKFIKKAIEYETERQIQALEKGETVLRETRRFDESTGKTYSMRSKEDSADYRFFTEPDLPPIELTDAYIDAVRNAIPELPHEKQNRFVREFNLSPYDAEMLVSSKTLSDCYERAVKVSAFPKILANLLISELLKPVTAEEEEAPIKAPAEFFAETADFLGRGDITSGTAKMLIRKTFTDCTVPHLYIEENNLRQINDEALLTTLAKEVIASDPKTLADYKKGKKTALKAFMGKIMAKTSGRANPTAVQKILEELLQKE